MATRSEAARRRHATKPLTAEARALISRANRNRWAAVPADERSAAMTALAHVRYDKATQATTTQGSVFGPAYTVAGYREALRRWAA